MLLPRVRTHSLSLVCSWCCSLLAFYPDRRSKKHSSTSTQKQGSVAPATRWAAGDSLPSGPGAHGKWPKV